MQLSVIFLHVKAAGLRSVFVPDHSSCHQWGSVPICGILSAVPKRFVSYNVLQSGQRYRTGRLSSYVYSILLTPYIVLLHKWMKRCVTTGILMRQGKTPPAHSRGIIFC